MSAAERATARRIVDVVLDELLRRKGVKQELEVVMLDHPDIWKELRETLTHKVDRVLQDEEANRAWHERRERRDV